MCLCVLHHHHQLTFPMVHTGKTGYGSRFYASALCFESYEAFPLCGKVEVMLPRSNKEKHVGLDILYLLLHIASHSCLTNGGFGDIQLEPGSEAVSLPDNLEADNQTA